MRTEKQLQDFIIQLAKSLGLLAYKLECTSRRGWPDLIIIAPDGEILFVEVKSPSGRGGLSPHQTDMIAELLEYRVDVVVWEDEAEARVELLNFAEVE